MFINVTMIRFFSLLGDLFRKNSSPFRKNVQTSITKCVRTMASLSSPCIISLALKCRTLFAPKQNTSLYQRLCGLFRTTARRSQHAGLIAGTRVQRNRVVCKIIITIKTYILSYAGVIVYIPHVPVTAVVSSTRVFIEYESRRIDVTVNKRRDEYTRVLHPTAKHSLPDEKTTAPRTTTAKRLQRTHGYYIIVLYYNIWYPLTTTPIGVRCAVVQCRSRTL